MMPQMSTGFFNWLSATQMKVIKKKPVDFEVEEDVVAIPIIEIVLEAMSPQKVIRKPEGERNWRWYDGWTTVEVKEDTVLQHPNGIEFRVVSRFDWTQAGFWHIELVEQPKGLGISP